jgi:hypothetical protein
MASDSILPAVIAAAATVAAAGGAAFFGAWLSPRRHRSEQLWDRKLEVYTEIFGAINQMQEEYDAFLDEETRANTFITPQYRSALVEATAKARGEVRKQSRIGSFLISETAEKLLGILLVELDKSGVDKTYFDRIDRHAAAVAETTVRLKTAARQDLKI